MALQLYECSWSHAQELTLNIVANYTDVGGLTPLHRAARIANTDLVQDLMQLRADPNAATYVSRSPGGDTPLQCFAEADQTNMGPDDVRTCTRMFLEGMDHTAVCPRTTQAATVFHMAVARGNIPFLEEFSRNCDPQVCAIVCRR